MSIYKKVRVYQNRRGDDMTQAEKKEYQKAYVELYEIIKVLPEEEQKQIPKIVLKNLKDNMDKEYKFILDKDSDILNQKYRIETKALFVELYERYLALKEESEIWNRYDKICDNMIEEEKKIKYNSDNIFKNKKLKKEELSATKESESNLPIEIKKESIVIKLFKFIKNIFH